MLRLRAGAAARYVTKATSQWGALAPLTGTTASSSATTGTTTTRAMSTGPVSMMHDNLRTVDPLIFDTIEKEKQRQRNSLTLIPSENFTSPAVLEALGSVMQNKYSEGCTFNVAS
jgi:glycine hydroxymethyltransferase